MNKKNKENKNKVFNKMTLFFKRHWTTPFKLMLFYILFIIVGSCLLYLPISLEHGYSRFEPVEGVNVGEYVATKSLTFWDSMFTVTSAFTNTGLTVTDIDYTYTFFWWFIMTWIF